MKYFKKVSFVWVLLLIFPFAIFAKSAAVIDAEADMAINQFYKEVKGSKTFLQKVEGYLVFPEVIKAGIGIGGEFGEGVLRVKGSTVDYYNTASASIGLQLGVQKKSIIIAFMTKKSLKDFRNSEGWKAGVDGSIAIAKWGAGKDISSVSFQKPIIGFIFANEGLMYNLTIEGSKFTKIHPR
jgi:lipid-binding SYLF domain-containing protein